MNRNSRARHLLFRNQHPLSPTLRSAIASTAIRPDWAENRAQGLPRRHALRWHAHGNWFLPATTAASGLLRREVATRRDRGLSQLLSPCVPPAVACSFP